MLWILLLVLVLLVAVALVGGFSYRGRAGAGAAASPQTTIIERGRNPDVSRRTESTTVTRETEVVDE
jgi:flagellar basal body-associated protein FliL